MYDPRIAAFFSTHTLHRLLENYGYAAVFLFVGIESLGIPFPGETMVIVAAVYAGATHHLTVWLIWLTAAAGAIVGDNIGFGVGHWGGYRLVRRYGRRVRLDEAKLKVGRLIFDRQGGRVVFFGRFVSILRTYAAFLAGTMRMRYPRFLFFNATGGIVWVWDLRDHVLLRRLGSGERSRTGRLRVGRGGRGRRGGLHRMAAPQRASAGGRGRAGVSGAAGGLRPAPGRRPR